MNGEFKNNGGGNNPDVQTPWDRIEEELTKEKAHEEALAQRERERAEFHSQTEKVTDLSEKKATIWQKVINDPRARKIMAAALTLAVAAGASALVKGEKVPENALDIHEVKANSERYFDDVEPEDLTFGITEVKSKKDVPSVNLYYGDEALADKAEELPGFEKGDIEEVTYSHRRKDSSDRFEVVDEGADGIPDEIIKTDSEGNQETISLENGIAEKLTVKNSDGEIIRTKNLSEDDEIKNKIGSNPRGITMGTVEKLF